MYTKRKKEKKNEVYFDMHVPNESFKICNTKIDEKEKNTSL